MHSGDIIEQLRHPDPARQHRDIGNERDIAHELIAPVPRIASEDSQLSFIGSEPENRIERGRFAGAVRTYDSENAALFDTQVYPIQRNRCAENFAEPVCFYRCHVSSGPPFSFRCCSCRSEPDWRCLWRQNPEISRKDAKPLRPGDEIRLFGLNAFFAPSRLSVKNSSLPCLAEISRKDAKPLRSRDEVGSFELSAAFASSRLGVKNSSLPRLAEISRKGVKPLRSGDETRFFDSDTCFAPSRLSEKDSRWDCAAEVSCSDATALRFFASQARRRSTSFAL